MLHKIRKEIKLNQRIITTIIFKKGDIYSAKLTERVKENFRQLKKFFQIHPPKGTLELIYSRKEMDEKVRRKTQDWLAGFTDPNKKIIYLISPSVFEEICTHSKKDLYKILIHEQAHLFLKKVNKNLPNWINEGLAMILASQTKNKPVKKENLDHLLRHGFFNSRINWLDFSEYQPYAASLTLTKYLLKKYKKNKILKWIRKNKNAESTDNNFKKTFKLSIENVVEKIKKEGSDT